MEHPNQVTSACSHLAGGGELNTFYGQLFPWTLTKKEEQALLIFERRIFRRIYGPKYENGDWKSRTNRELEESRTNRELEEMSKGENIVKWIKGQRISWLGHLQKMEEDRMPKKIFTQELEETRRRGRPGKDGKRK